jgi:hypothetical protein
MLESMFPACNDQPLGAVIDADPSLDIITATSKSFDCMLDGASKVTELFEVLSEFIK